MNYMSPQSSSVTKFKFSGHDTENAITNMDIAMRQGSRRSPGRSPKPGDKGQMKERRFSYFRIGINDGDRVNTATPKRVELGDLSEDEEISSE